MKSIEANKELIAACGLYCGACRKYLSDKCPGCHNNEKATWCKIRSCAKGNGYHSCAECLKNVTECTIYSNLIERYSHFFSGQTVRLASATSVSMANKLSLRK